MIWKMNGMPNVKRNNCQCFARKKRFMVRGLVLDYNIKEILQFFTVAGANDLQNLHLRTASNTYQLIQNVPLVTRVTQEALSAPG